ncbi:transposase [Candidatus Methanarcanum hacksteinii]|uniref:transposase n=1 Tax=Candidatus Methanarcanum hacksteinii TaxID=2911857 RepID=UPI0037DD3BF3
MKKAVPGFGRACYMDSTPLPNDIDDNPFNALCSHGTGSPEIQMRLVLVIDSITGLPVWYELIPGNVLDLNTLKNFTDNVKASIDVEITEYVLDAGYANKELIQAYPAQSEDAAVDDVDCDEMIPERNIVVRMPAKKGYPFKTLYHDCKPLMSYGKYDFVRDKHMYLTSARRIDFDSIR